MIGKSLLTFCFCLAGIVCAISQQKNSETVESTTVKKSAGDVTIGQNDLALPVLEEASILATEPPEEILLDADDLIGPPAVIDLELEWFEIEIDKQLFQTFTGESAAEINMALKWIASHQLPDGGWSFDHTIGPGEFRDSPNPGTFQHTRNAATGMALMPFLKAGQTHLEGNHHKVVEAGLNYLHTEPGS